MRAIARAIPLLLATALVAIGSAASLPESSRASARSLPPALEGAAVGQEAAPACPGSLGPLTLAPEISSDIRSGPGESYTLGCNYGEYIDRGANEEPDFRLNMARVTLRWNEGPAPPMGLASTCGADDQLFPDTTIGDIGQHHLFSDDTVARVQFDADAPYADAIEDLARSLLTSVEPVSTPCNPLVYCPPAPDGFRLGQRPADFEVRANGVAEYTCAYDAAPDGANPPLIQLDTSWAAERNDRLPTSQFCVEERSAGPGNVDFQKYLLDDQRQIAVRYLGRESSEAIALAMAKETLQVTRELALPCEGVEEGPVDSGAEPTATPNAVDEDSETAAERVDRQIAQNLTDYLELRHRIDASLESLYRQADLILEELRLWRWDERHGTEADQETAAAEIARLQEEMAALLAEFEDLVDPLTDVLGAIEGQFAGTAQHDELLVVTGGFRSELDLLRINLVLRSGNTEQFDALFTEYSTDENIAAQVFVANAFRQLMDGDTRIALESVRRALDRDPTNATALQLRHDLELTYLGRIRDQLSRELGTNAQLFNAKLNGHGKEGVGQFLIDVFTTAPGESALAVAGYYDLLEEVAGINIDEATEQIAGIRLLEDMLQSGFALEELNDLSVERMVEIAQSHYNREITEEQARDLRDRIFDAFKNVDVDAIRRGDPTQYNVDVGRDYFDTEVLQSGGADVVLRQFSAWDTFLTFAPSAQLGRVARTGVAARLGLTSSSTLQQGLQRGLRIQELGARIYQSPTGAAAIDAIHEWRGFELMVADAIKARVGNVAYAAGSAAVSGALNELSAPARKALAEELRLIGDYYLGAETVGNVEATAETLSAFFNFVGANVTELERGAYGANEAAEQLAFVDAEIALDKVTIQSDGVAAARGATLLSFDEFEEELSQGGSGLVDNLEAAADGLSLAADDPNVRRRVLADRAGETIAGMRSTAEALASGDRATAQRLWQETQAVAGAFERSLADQSQRLSEFEQLSRELGRLATSTPNDRNFASTVAGKLSGATPSSASTLVGALSSAGLQAVPKNSPDYRLPTGTPSQ
jgi:hypothetical protein